ncbi:MAG: NosR/NirI family protein [Paracoccaceae bacterium]|nr:NosR/NirI family protein [Paracoccaceae bacterium]
MKRLFLSLFLVTILFGIAPLQAAAQTSLTSYLAEIEPEALAPGATGFGPVQSDLPVAPVLSGQTVLAWAFVTSDFVGTTGYSGKPIDVVMAISPDAIVTGAVLAHHSEPIVLVGIPEAKIRALIDGYAGADLKQEVIKRGTAHDLDIISGATVTVMVIDDSILRAGVKVARQLDLGGLALGVAKGPKYALSPNIIGAPDWQTLAGDGSIRRLSIDVGQINAAFAATGDARAISRPEPGAPSDTFIDLNAALVSIPTVGRALLGEAEYNNLQAWLEEGDHAILVAGRGVYSFKGSGYVRGGIFDRISVSQADITLRFRDRMHRRLLSIAAPGAPSFKELDLFRIPADTGFDPTQPWSLQLLVQRAVGAVDKTFLTFDLGYVPPEKYLLRISEPVPAAMADEDEAGAKAALWKRVWLDRQIQIAGLLAMLLILTGAFFFQMQLTRNPRVHYWFRIGFLSTTLVFLGWMANAQLSVVNLMALAGSLRAGFTWDAFLLDPLIFILWFSVAASLLFWGRGAFCGWLCPFGALQELSNKIGRLFHIPQIKVPWGLHERLWPIKYLIFLALFGLSLASMSLAEHYAEIEPFKTAIILKFGRAWPFVVFALAMLTAGLFIDRFYCRYLCPLGAALAIPARMRMFDWLKRYHECGNPCHLCAIDCPVQAIHPTGEINPNECINCLNCQVLYQSKSTCPVVIKQEKRRARDRAASEIDNGALDRALSKTTGKKETRND